MPSDDYAVAGGGALKLKGAKIDKKKKKKKSKSDLEKNLTTGDDEGAVVKKGSPAAEGKETKQRKEEEPEEDNEAPEVRKTEAELRYEEYKKKRVSNRSDLAAGGLPQLTRFAAPAAEDGRVVGLATRTPQDA